MLITIYMTVKNGLPHIVDAIESIRHQTYGNWEVVIVDDGSIDSTPAYLKKIADLDARFRVILTDGIGRAKALNLAVAHARGDIIANIDADDCFHPQKIELQVPFFFDNEGQFLCTKIEIFSSILPSFILDISKGKAPRLLDIGPMMVRRSDICHSSVMMRKSAFIEIGQYDECRRMQVDYDLWYRLAGSGLNIYMLDRVLVGKRVHQAQSFENKSRLKYLISAYKIKFAFLDNVDAPFRYKLLASLKFFYGLLPQGIRMHIKYLVNR